MGAREDVIDLRHEAQQALEAANGNVERGVKIMAERVRSNAALFKALLDPLVVTACYDKVAEVCRIQRRSVWNAPNYSPSGNGERVLALAAGNLLLFPLPGGKALGEATRVEVQEAAEFYRAQADDMHHKAAWLGAIAGKVTKGKRVRQVLTPEDLSALREQTR